MFEIVLLLHMKRDRSHIRPFGFVRLKRIFEHDHFLWGMGLPHRETLRRVVQEEIETLISLVMESIGYEERVDRILSTIQKSLKNRSSDSLHLGHVA